MAHFLPHFFLLQLNPTYMKWIEIALKYCTFTLISSLEQKEAIFNVKYEIVLRTPHSKARCPAPPSWKNPS